MELEEDIEEVLRWRRLDAPEFAMYRQPIISVHRKNHGTEDEQTRVIFFGGQSESGYLSDILEFEFTDTHQKVPQSQQTQLYFKKCLAQSFQENAQSSLALIQDANDMLHIAHFSFESDNYEAKAHLEITDTIGTIY